jgi:hypothetical protein
MVLPIPRLVLDAEALGVGLRLFRLLEFIDSVMVNELVETEPVVRNEVRGCVLSCCWELTAMRCRDRLPREIVRATGVPLFDGEESRIALHENSRGFYR